MDSVHDPIFDDLNPAQREAVAYGEGPLMVVAGAGSGKTRVITRRIARLLRDGVPRECILALTFTNKAAQEMARRVEELGGHRVHVSTFHSACARFLRSDGHHLGYPRDYSIYDTYDRDSCIKMLMQERGIPLSPVKPAHVGKEISRLKNLSAPADEYREANAHRGLGTVQGLVAELFSPYQQRLKRLGAMDFDDLLCEFCRLLADHPEVADAYRERYQWILVDEFQDTNPVQYELTRQLAKGRGNVCVVGDPDQSIYRFRGAEIRNILDFKRDFPTVHTARLEINYRSTKRILRAAQGLIEHNEERLERGLDTHNAEGDKLVYHRYDSPFEETAQIARKIIALFRQGTSLDEIAVFYRSHFLSRGIEDVLRRAVVPYEVIGGLSFFERREIKDLLAYLRVVTNPLDDVSMERIINVPPRFLGKTSVQKLLGIAARNEMSLFETVMDPELHGELAPRARKSLATLAKTFETIRERAEISASDPLRTVLEETGFVEYACNLGDPQDVAREENIQELVNDAVDFDTRYGSGLAGYLSHVSLLTSEDRRQNRGPTVSLMTVHAAKGLEFDHVFAIGLEDGLFPSSRAEEEGDIEEERRLMYVAITRGRKTVHLSGCNLRRVQGYERDQIPSRFLREIPAECVHSVVRDRDAWQHWDSDAGGDDATGVDDDPDAAMEPEWVSSIDAGLGGDDLRPKMRVVHEVYGEGAVVRLSGTGLRSRVVVQFDDGQERDLLVEYARLQVVGEGDDW